MSAGNYKKLGKDVVLMTIGNFGSRILSFLLVPLYTSVLTTEEYGTADLISTTITLLLPFFTLIIFEAMMRFALDKENNPSEIWKVGLRIELVGCLALLVLSPIILLTPMKDYYFFVIAYYIADSFQRCASYFVRGLNKVKVFAISGVIQTAVMIACNLIFLLGFKIGITGYLLSHVISSVVSTIYLLYFGGVFKYGFHIGNIDKELQKRMLAYAIPMIPNSVCWWIANASNRYMLTAMVGVAVTGIFSVAYKIPTIISTLSSIFGSAWKLTAVEDFGTDKSRSFFEDIFSKLSTLMILATAGLTLINKPLASILFAKDFYIAWQCVPLLVFSAAMHSYSEFFGSIYTSAYKTKFLVYSTVIGSVVNVALNLLLISKYQALGAAFATFAGQAVIAISRMINSRRIMKIHYHYLRDGICYVLLCAEIFIGCNSFKYEYAYSGILLIFMVMLLRAEIIGVVKMLLRKRIKRY